MCTCAYVCTTANVCQSGDNLWLGCLPPPWVPGTKLKSSCFCSLRFTCSAIQPALAGYFFETGFLNNPVSHQFSKQSASSKNPFVSVSPILGFQVHTTTSSSCGCWETEFSPSHVHSKHLTSWVISPPGDVSFVIICACCRRGKEFEMSHKHALRPSEADVTWYKNKVPAVEEQSSVQTLHFTIYRSDLPPRPFK